MVGEVDILAKCLNVGVAEAAAAYAQYRDEQLRAERATVEFLAEAGQILSSSLDYRSTLARLTALVVPRLADWCAVRLENDTDDTVTIAHAEPAKVELVRALYRRYSERHEGELDWQKVLRTGEPELAPEGDAEVADPAAAGAALRAERRALAASWLVVPLQVQGNVFGTITLAFSDSGRRYRESDLFFAGELARRASVAVDNARLYELSQRERSRAEAATRAKDEFVAIVSHELRTPLHAILGWTRLLRRGSLSTDKQSHAIDTIERNAQAQAQLVEDLLDVSRVMTGKVRINPAQVDFCSIVELAVEGVRPAADAKHIRMDVQLADCDFILRADGDRIQQVAWILLANAVKYSPKYVGLVRVQLRRVESIFELTIEDNGVGIDPKFLPHVFEAFRQFDGSPSRQHGGLGVGLSIAKHIVELHGGVIEAHSDGTGKGTRMVVRLPISPLVSRTLGIKKVAATTEAQASAPGTARGKNIAVLVVDDDPDAREILTFVLKGAGMNVSVASSVAEARTELATRTFDLLISDIGMPGEDGYALIRAIRTGAAETSNMPAIALTAFASREDRNRALTEGFNRHMVKPTDPGALVEAARELVG